MKRICVRVSDDEFKTLQRTLLQMHERNPHLKVSTNKIMRALLLDWLNAVKESNNHRAYPDPKDPRRI